MKHLYVLLFTLAFLSAKTQNWQSVYSDRLVYFDSSQQAIKIVSTSVDSTGDSTFKNYPQLFMDSLGRTEYLFGRVVDSVSWIGRRIVIKPNGYNGFANESNEYSWLNTLANLNDTFVYFDSKKMLVKAYCNRVFYADTFGVKDSVKQFKFIYSNKAGYTNPFDTTIEILLSKHHGLLKTPAFCAIWSRNNYSFSNKTSYEYCPKNYFTNRRFNDLDIGDEYEYTITNDENNYNHYESKYYYQVTKKEPISGSDSIKYTYKVKLMAIDKYKFEDPKSLYGWYWKNTIKHFVYNETETLLVNDEPINGWLPSQLENRNGGNRKFFVLGDTCNLLVLSEYYGVIEDTITNIFIPPFEGDGGVNIYSRIGKMYWYIDGSGWNPNGVGRRYDITYRNFCNTISGEPFAKIYVYGVGIEEINGNEIKLYPNPANSTVSISTPNIIAISLTDISGKKIDLMYTNSDDINTFDISVLPAGVYFCEVETEKGKTTHKLLVQH